MELNVPFAKVKKAVSLKLSFILVLLNCVFLLNVIQVEPVNAGTSDACTSSYTANNLIASPSHGSAFYIDTGITPILDSGFVGYQIANTSNTAMSNYWVKISNFLGGKLSLVNNDDQFFRLSDIAAAKTVTAASISSNIATLTSTSHGLSAGDSITVTGISATFNGTFSISSVTANTFTYRKTASNTSLTGLSGKVSPTQTAFFMLKASSSTTAAQTHDISIYNMKPDLNGATELFSCRYTFTKIKETIKANSNKVADNGFSTSPAAITISDSTPELGQSVTITVEGATGNVGSGNAPDYDIFWVTPAAISTWPTRALRLEQTQIIIDKGDNWTTTNDQTVFTNQLAIFNASDTDLISNSGSEYRATYTFKVIGKPNSTIKVVPVAQIASGTQIKHTATDAANATLDIGISSFTTSYSLDKSATCASATSGTGDKANYIAVPYTLTASSNSATSTTFDEFVDTPATGAIFKTGSARLTDVNNTNVTLSDPTYLSSESGLSPQPLHFANKFTVNSSRTAVLTYEMWIPKAAGTYSNTASIKIGDQTVGKTSSTVPQVQLTTDGTTASTCNSTTTSLSVEATTYPATSIANTTATLNAIVDPNSVSGQTAEFEYGTSPTLASKTTVTATTPASGALSGSDPVESSVGLTGLSTGTKYYFRIKVGDVYGDILSFVTTQPIATPTITTDPPTNVSATNATLNGTIDPNLTDSSVSFTISTASDLLTSPTTVRLTENPALAYNNTSNPYAVFSSAFATQVSINMTDNGMPSIVANRTYYYRANYLNTSGTLISSGDIKSFVMTTYVDQTITFADLSNKTYGDSAIVTTPTASSNLTVVLTSNTTGVCTVSGFTITIIGAGYCEIAANQSGGLNSGVYYNPAPEVIKTFNIDPKSLTVTGSTHSINYGDAAPSPTPSYSAFAYSETASNLTTQPTCSTNYTQGDSVGTSRSTTCSGGSSNNYVFSYVSGSVTINKKTMRVTASSHTVTYGDSAPVVSPSYTSGDFYGSDTATAFDTPPSCTTNYVDGDGYGTSRSTSCSGGLDNNYDFSYTSGSVTINKASLTITASSPATINTGDPVPTITPSYSGLVNSENGSVVVTSLVCSTTYTTSSSAGTFSTSCSGGVASNYTIFYTSGSFVANNASLLTQTITFNSIGGITYGDSSPSVSPSTTATGLSVTLTSNSTDVCTVLSNSPWTITILKPGVCSITASQPGDSTYNPASDVTRTFNVGTKTLTVTSGKVTADNKQYNDNLTAALTIASGALTGVVGSDSVSLSIGSVSPVFASKNVDTNIVVTYTGVFTLSGTNSAYYTLTQPSLSLTANITKAPLTITASSHTLTVGSAVPTISPSYTGFEGDDDDSQLSSLVCTTTYTTSSSAGTYVTSCSGASSTNYSLIYVNGSVTANSSSSGGGGTGGGGGGGGGGTTTSSPTPTPTPTPSPTSTRRNSPNPAVIRRTPIITTPTPQPTSTTILQSPFPLPSPSLRELPTNDSPNVLAIVPQTPNSPINLATEKPTGTIENGSGKIIVAPDTLIPEIESFKSFIQQFNNSAIG
ncbi:MAG: beta strand repeat-containing protein, partial [Actinomycetes bacterium]